MTTAVIGTGGIGSAIARQLASGGETLRLSSADTESARTLAAEIGPAAVVAADNRDALRGVEAIVLALRFTVLKSVIDEVADQIAGKVVVVPSNPLSTDAHGKIFRVLPEGQSSGEPVKIGGIEQSGRLEAGGDLHDLILGPAKARSLIVGPDRFTERKPCGSARDRAPAVRRAGTAYVLITTRTARSTGTRSW